MKLKKQTQRPSHGFTMIELLVVLVVISLLAAIAVPQYNNFLQDARRTEAFSALNQVATRLEQFHSERNTYTEDLTTLGFTAVSWNNTENGNYRVRVVPATNACPIASCFRLNAEPVQNSAQWGDDYWYELFSTGQRGSRVCPLNNCTGAWVNGWIDD